MNLQTGVDQETFLELLKSQHDDWALNDPLLPLRKKAWDHFLHLGLPSRQNDLYRYIKLRQLYNSPLQFASVPTVNIDEFILPECQNSVIVFVNGAYQHSLSRISSLPQKLVIVSLDQALRTYGTLLNNSFAKMLREENDPFAALNGALHPQGLFIYVPPKVVIEQPIQLLHFISTEQSALLMPRVHLFAGSQSEIRLVATQEYGSQTKVCTNQVIEMALEEDAKVRYTKVLGREPSDSWNFDALRATLKRNSNLNTVQVTKGSATVRQDARVILTGENAEAMLNGIWMLEGNREAHTNILIDHQAPHCRSFQHFKGVLGGTSRSSFEGKIMVRKEAQKTEAFQKNPNLLLSERAHADSAPNLEIFADDVKASHGATVGQLDQEQMFYMKTRGILAEEAKRLLVNGFCQEILDLVDLPSLR